MIDSQEIIDRAKERIENDRNTLSEYIDKVNEEVKESYDDVSLWDMSIEDAENEFPSEDEFGDIF